LFATLEKTDKIAQALRLKAKGKILNACKVGKKANMQRDKEQCETFIGQSVYQKYGLTSIILEQK